MWFFFESSCRQIATYNRKEGSKLTNSYHVEIGANPTGKKKFFQSFLFGCSLFFIFLLWESNLLIKNHPTKLGGWFFCNDTLIYNFLLMLKKNRVIRILTLFIGFSIQKIINYISLYRLYLFSLNCSLCWMKISLISRRK